MPKTFLSCGAIFGGNVGAKTYIYHLKLESNESSDQLFPIAFLKNENNIYVQKGAFSRKL